MTILIFAVILIVLILVHELGHFLAAKLFGIRVDEFGLGFPPKLWGKKIGETEYTVNALPIGGFVRIYGEDLADVPENDSDRLRSMAAKPRIAQAIVLSAGVFFNVLFACIVFTLGFMFGMPSGLTEEEAANANDVKLLVTEVLPGSPSAEAGVLPGDQIVGLAATGGSFVDSLTPDAVGAFISAHEGQGLTLALNRGGEEQQVTLTPRAGVLPDEPSRPAAGFVMNLAGVITLPFHEAVVEGARMTVSMFKMVAVGVVGFFAQVFTFKADLSYVSGPVGIVGLVGDARALGVAYLVSFTAFISLNLAVINLLPFPALDGGRLFFLGIESIIRRPISPRITKSLNTVGFLILIGLMLVVTVSDVLKLV